MIKVFRFLAICTISVAFVSIASAQSYKTIDFPGATATTLNGGPNPQGTSVGGYTDTSGVIHGFTLTKGGVFTSFDPPGSTLTLPNFISPQGVIVGSYLDSTTPVPVSHGFILNGGKYTTVNAPGAAGTVLTGINPLGEISGYTCSDLACGNTGNPSTNQSFLESKKGVFTFFDPPGATGGSQTSTVNPSGAVVGNFTNNGTSTCFTECQGYLLFQGKYTTVNFANSAFTFAGGGNPPNDVAGTYFDTAGTAHGFLFSNGNYTSFDYPEAVFTEATGINPGGVIVGVYFDSAIVEHGYIRTP